MKKLISILLSAVLMLGITAGLDFSALADEHTVRTQALVLGSESMHSLQEGWDYIAPAHTLYLNNATIDCSKTEDGNCITASGDLCIALAGESTLISKTELNDMSTRYCPIKVNGDLTFLGRDVLNIREGNQAIYQSNKDDNKLIINGGTINISHDFDSYVFDTENSNAFGISNQNYCTIVNNGIINSDVSFFASEINGGEISAPMIASKKGLTVNSGKINTGMLYAVDLTINGGTVNATGGYSLIFIKDYSTAHNEIGVMGANSLVINGGNVNAHGSWVGVCGIPNCVINGGNLVAESEGVAIAASDTENDIDIVLNSTVRVEEPENYTLEVISVESQNSFASINDPTTQTNYVKTFFDDTVNEPYITADSAAMTISSNAAKRVVISELERRTLKFNDENGNETYSITVTENDYDKLLSQVISEQLNVPQEKIYIIFGVLGNKTVSEYLEVVDSMASEGYDVNGELIIDNVWGTADNYNPDWLGDYENTSEYHIKDARDFAAFKKSCFVDGNRFEGKTVYLDNDVDLGEHFWYVGASKVVTDDGSTNYPKFSGVFDGCGHAVTGLKMFPVGGIATAGLFPFLKNAVVKNLTVDGVAMRSNLHWLGLLAGYAVDSAVYNCFASGTIECVGRERNYDPGSTGALIGEAQHCAVINCGADADISLDYEHIVKHNYSGGMPKLGVLIGEATTKVEESFCVINCYSHGSISVLNTFQSAKVGGLIGVADDDLYNCYTDVQLTPNRPYSMYGTLVGEIHAENVLNNAGQDGDNLGQYIIGNLFYPQGAQPFGWNNSVFHNTARRDVSEFASAFETAEELCAALNAGVAQVDEIIAAHRDVLADSSWADLLEQCNANDIEAMYWRISDEDNMPAFAETYQGFTYEIADNEAVITGYLGVDADITIPGEINGVPVTEIAPDALSGNGNLVNIVISDGINKIGSYAFANCSSLKSVTIPSSVTVIEEYIVGNCSGLSHIQFDGTLSELNSIDMAPNALNYGGGLPLIIYFNPDPEPEPEPLTGWQFIDGVWYYYDTEGSIVTGWLKDGDKWYFLDADGKMHTGWLFDNSKWYYLNKSGAMQTGWLKDGNNWYYLKSNGAMANGWVKDGGKWYFLKSNGAMAIGWQQVGGKWYYLNSNGAMQTGWLLYKNNWYYLDASGAMRTANLTYKGKVYKFNSSGACINP